MITRRGLLAALPLGAFMTTPQTSSWPLNQTGTVVLDGSGNGTVQLTPDGPSEHWQATLASVKASSNTKEASCKIYAGPSATDQFFVDGTLSGSTGDSTDRLAGYDIARTGPFPSIWAVWAGGDVGATATLVLAGTRSFQ